MQRKIRVGVSISSFHIDVLSDCLSFRFCFMVFLVRKQRKRCVPLGFFVGFFWPYPYLVYCLGPLCVLSHSSYTFLGPSCVGLFCALSPTNLAERNELIRLDECLFHNLPPLPLLQWCFSSYLYSNFRCLYLSWFLLGFQPGRT
jgi:hypothetical protein